MARPFLIHCILENWYVYMSLPAHYGEPPYKPILGTDSLAIGIQNRFWYPKLIHATSLGRVGAGTQRGSCIE